MTTNKERAVEVMRNFWHDGRYAVGFDEIADALADAGLLTSDLPEPETDIDRLIWRVDEEGFVYRKPDGRISTIGVGNPYPSVEIAQRHALAILAATNHYTNQEKK